MTKGGRDYETYILSGSKPHQGYAGGIFFELARKVIEDNGLSIGAAYAEDFHVEHMAANNMEQLKRLIGVKYAESRINKELRRKILYNLDTGQVILFAGTPCQVKELYSYLGKTYENLYTIVIKCPGVICSRVWKDYVEETQSCGSIITEIYYPYRKEFGISQRKALIKFSHGTAYFRDEKDDKLLRLKNRGLIFKEECYQCGKEREEVQADFFLETYYEQGIRNAVQEEGLTKTTVCTDKGYRLFKTIQGRLSDVKKITTSGEKPCTKISKPGDYERFWKYYDLYGFTFASNLMMSEMDSSLKNRYQLKFLKQYTILDSKGISIEKCLKNWGLEKIILYGDGMLGKMIADKLNNAQMLYAVVNQGITEEESEKTSIPVKKIDEIVDSDIPILIVPCYFMPDVITELVQAGISRKRLLPLRLLTSVEYDDKVLNGISHGVWDEKNGGIGEIYLITGAQFGNKGAQSMLFTAVSELRRIHPDCDIYYLPIDNLENYPDSILSRYRFHIIREPVEIYSQFYELMPQLKAIVDVSGYALSSKWNSGYFVQILLLAKNNDIPIYFMPQSFGPFDFPFELEKKIKEGLAHANVIYARETYGYDLLVRKYGLNNVQSSRDLVLQNKGLIEEHIYLETLRAEDYQLDTGSNVAVIPNIRNYEFGNRRELLKVYRELIAELLKCGKSIYIVCHSDDEKACNDIYELFSDNPHVLLYKKRLDCLEFSILVRQFQYIIASRYHAIVHAYKEGIPCVSIGWAEKYRELLSLFGQEAYVFDVRQAIDSQKLINAVLVMNEKWVREKGRICEILPTLQTENCFDLIE